MITKQSTVTKTNINGIVHKNVLSKTFRDIWVEEWSSWMELERGFLQAEAAGLIG